MSAYAIDTNFVFLKNKQKIKLAIRKTINFVMIFVKNKLLNFFGGNFLRPLVKSVYQ